MKSDSPLPGVAPDQLDALLDRDKFEAYLLQYFGTPVTIESLRPLGGDSGAKGFGYGVPIRLRLSGAPVDDVVIHFAGSGGFGHDSLTDRAREALLPYETFNSFEGHVPALDIGVLAGDGALRSLGEVRDFFFVTAYAEGTPYFEDLGRIAQTGDATARDLYRVEALVDLLARNHSAKKDEPELYRRRLRDLFGHHECIAGLIDSYDALDLGAFGSAETLRRLERRGVEWRHAHKRYTARLSRVHGDFHPWNVLFDDRDRPTALDRTRGEWGEPADDVACLAVNYLFFSLRAAGRLAGGFERLWNRFFEGYTRLTADPDLGAVLPPYLCWRALVLASPVWYPDVDDAVRAALFTLIDHLVVADAFDYRDVNRSLIGSP